MMRVMPWQGATSVELAFMVFQRRPASRAATKSFDRTMRARRIPLFACDEGATENDCALGG